MSTDNFETTINEVFSHLRSLLVEIFDGDNIFLVTNSSG
ncbi:hypothetical protein OR221_2999, partial [Microbacterium laevaniformans OR221]